VEDENETFQEEGTLEDASEETDVEEEVVQGSGEENEADEVVEGSGEENEVEEVVDESGEENQGEEVVEELGEKNEAEEVVEELGEESPAEVAELSNEEKLSVRLGDAQKLSDREEMKESLGIKTLQTPPPRIELPEDDDSTVEDLDTMVSKESALLTNDEDMVEKLLEQTADTEYDDNEEYDDSQYEEEEELLEEAEVEEDSLIQQPGQKGAVDPSFLEPGLQEIATELTKSQPSNGDEYESEGSEPMEIEGEEAEKESEGSYYENTDKVGGEGEYDDYEEEEEFDAEAAKKFVEAGESLEDVGLEEMEENDEILRQTEMQLEDEEEIESEIDSESDETPPF